MDSKSIKMRLEGNWNKVKGALKEKYGELTDDDLVMEEGRAEQWIGKIQTKLGKTRQEIIDEIEEMTSWFHWFHPYNKIKYPVNFLSAGFFLFYFQVFSTEIL